MVIQFSGFLDSWYKARAVDLCTFSSCDLRYFTSGATAPSRPNAVLLFPQLQHLAMASAKCLRSLSSTCEKIFMHVKRFIWLYCEYTNALPGFYPWNKSSDTVLIVSSISIFRNEFKHFRRLNLNLAFSNLCVTKYQCIKGKVWAIFNEELALYFPD